MCGTRDQATGSTVSISPLPAVSTSDRVAHLNLENVPDKDGTVRGSILPVGVAQGSLRYCVSVITLVVFVAWPWLYVSLLISCFFSRISIALVAILISTLFLPAQLLWPKATRSYILTTWQEFFNFSWICEEVVSADQNVIFAEFPHGAFPFGPFLAAGPCAVYYPGKQVYALAASVLFWLPGYRHLMTWIGCLPASRSNLNRLLDLGSVAVIVGGIAEMWMLHHDREEVQLRGRMGLMKTAVERHVPIVPVYYLGNSRILAFGPRALRHLSRRLRASLGFVMGRWGLPIPIQHPITMVAGKPVVPDTIDIAPGDEGYPAALRKACESLTERLAAELQALYNRHRHEMPGWEDRPLIIN